MDGRGQEDEEVAKRSSDVDARARKRQKQREAKDEALAKRLQEADDNISDKDDYNLGDEDPHSEESSDEQEVDEYKDDNDDYNYDPNLLREQQMYQQLQIWEACYYC